MIAESEPLLLVFIAVSLLLYLFGYKKLFYANGFVIACFSACVFLFKFYDIGIAWYMGYLYEQMAFYLRRDFPIRFYILGLSIFLLLFIFNFSRFFRKSIHYQIIAFICAAGVLFLESYYILAVRIDSFSIHRFFELLQVRIPDNSIYYLPILLGIDWILVKTNLLPEFRENRTKGTYDALIDEENK